MRKFTISDIHGCYQTLLALLDKVAFSSTDELYLLGDYVDRGPESKQVLEHIIQMKEDGYKVHCLAGNHDLAMRDALKDSLFFDTWRLGWGGAQTMKGFDVRYLEEITDRYWSFIKELDFVLEIDDYILVHAGLDFYKKNPLEPHIDMLYLRNWYKYINYEWLGNRKIVHGHTPTPIFQIEYMLEELDKKQVIDIDAGCFDKHNPGMGHLCAFELTNRQLTFQERLDNVDDYWG